jgi:hypothetical protein
MSSGSQRQHRYSATIKWGKKMKMKTKTWTVITNTGKQADLESGVEKSQVDRPTHISAREFVHWLAPESHIDDNSLRIDTAHCTPAVLASTVSFPTGATPTVSAAGSTATDGIVWAIWATGAVQNPLPTTSGVLYAFDAVTVTTTLYSSNTCPNRDKIAPGTKFSVPTVANGKVFVGAEQGGCSGSSCTNNGTGTFYIFGPSATGSC